MTFVEYWATWAVAMTGAAAGVGVGVVWDWIRERM
jgi:hypothetical protein